MERKKVSIKLPVPTSLDADSKHVQLSSRQSAPATAGNEANLTNTSSSSTSSSSLSPPGFLKNVQAALKRHRPLGAMPSAALRVRRVPVSHGQVSTGDGDAVASMLDKVSVAETVSLDVSFDQGLSIGNVEATLPLPEDPLPSRGSSADTGTLTSAVPRIGKVGNGIVVPNKVRHSSHSISSSLPMGSQAVVPVGGQDDVQHYVAARGNSACHEGDGTREPLEGKNLEQRQQGFQPTEAPGINLKACPLEKISREIYDQQRLDPMTQCSTLGSCATSMSLLSCPIGRCTKEASSLQNAIPTQMSLSGIEDSVRVQNHSSPNRQRALKESNSYLGLAKAPHFDEVIGVKSIQVDASSLQDPSAGLKNSSAVSAEPTQTTKSEKAPRKKKYDPDMFFKVNGKLYQKLGKIGSGGSSEVYKVITSDCTIYALKRIKLKGRDYPTAYGFCQEIEYLNKLKGKSNIIELVDYEVTDKTLLDEVMGGSLTIKDGRIKDDCYIYMVLEYGEIDLAHMLSQKWKEAEATNRKINDNWLRFYWQQMLEAVNTIHEERIVHSDLKPANFLLVKGSLKLIDFGIAKAILSDTTNIQREAQVGTLNYMSPEAFMWNERDSNGNTIKCGRPSDIWSLGCILYQMVYGKTPFAEYKTFWAKFKVITDRNHEIKYGPISNPWLIDLMKKCLAWDRKERWRIPQLLQHPFLDPPLPPLEIVYTKDEKIENS